MTHTDPIDQAAALRPDTERLLADRIPLRPIPTQEDRMAADRIIEAAQDPTTAVHALDLDADLARTRTDRDEAYAELDRVSAALNRAGINGPGTYGDRIDAAAEALARARTGAHALEVERDDLRIALGRADAETAAMVRDRDEVIRERDQARHERDTLTDAIARMISLPPDAVAHAYNVRYGPAERPNSPAGHPGGDDAATEAHRGAQLLDALDAWAQHWHRYIAAGAHPAHPADIALLAAYDAHRPDADAPPPGSGEDRAQDAEPEHRNDPPRRRAPRIVPYAERAPLYAAYQAARDWAEQNGESYTDDGIIQAAVKAYGLAQMPAWVLDLVQGLADYEDEHPALYRRMDGSKYERWTCPGALLDLVPSQVLAEAGRRGARCKPADSPESIRPADWEQRAVTAARDGLAAAWPNLGAGAVAEVAVRAIIDAGLAGPGGRCPACGQTYPRTPDPADPRCWTCSSEPDPAEIAEHRPGVTALLAQIRHEAAEVQAAALADPDGDHMGPAYPANTHDHSTGYPLFAHDAELIVGTSDGPQPWTGTEWNEHVRWAARARGGVTERLVTCPTSVCTTACPANPDRIDL
ncbi:hypothetical protein [Micromonospora haikouensis]|uniref:hypothetical protein n=1 Tax=Micromonospora haikouensis TaxID=686309 RepID=UPI003D75DD30